MDVLTPLDLQILIAATNAAGTARSISTADAVDIFLNLVSPGGDGKICGILNEIWAKNRERAEKKEALQCVQVMADLVRRLGMDPVLTAIHLGLPLVPPFLGQGGTLEEMVHGVNFASAAAGIIFPVDLIWKLQNRQLKFL